MFRKYFILTVLLIVQVAMSAPLRVGVIQRGKNNANFGMLQQTYEKFVRELERVKDFQVDDKVDLDKAFGIPLSPDFSQIIDPVNLYEMNEKLELDLVVFFLASAEELTITVNAFPSGIQLNTRTIKYTIADMLLLDAELKSHVTLLGNTLPSQYGRYGFPFASSDFGVLICTDDIHHIDLAKTLDLMNRTYFKNTRLSMGRSLKNVILKERSISCYNLSELCKDMNAQIGFFFSAKNRDNHIIAFPTPDQERNYTSVQFPILPGNVDLTCYQCNPNQYDAETIVNILVGDNLPTSPSASMLPLYTLRTMRMHNDWTTGMQRSNPFKNQIHSAYQLLEQLSAEQSLQRAWINLNHAAFSGMVYDFNRADSLLTNALGLFLLHYDNYGEMLCRIEEGRQLMMAEKWEKADDVLARLLKKQSTRLDSVSEAEIHYSLGHVNEQLGKNQDAIHYYQTSLRIHALLGDSFRAMAPQLELGQLYRKLGNYTQAAQAINRYYTIANTLHSEPDMARARYELGLVNLANNQLEQATKDFNVAKEMFEMLGEDRFLAYIYLNQGVINLKTNQYVKANLNINKAKELATKIGETVVVIDSYRYMGDTESAMGDWVRAQGFYDTGIDLAINSGHMDRVAELMYAKGLAHLQQGNVQIGYTEVKKGIELSDGKVHGDRESANNFLKRLERIIAQKKQQLISQ